MAVGGAVLLIVLLTLAGGVVSKYVNSREVDAYVTAPAFYFESNYLTEDNHEYKLNAGTTSLQIELYNFENELRVSEVDCTYTVSVETKDTNFSPPSQTLEAEATGEGRTTSFTLNGLKNGCSYTVTVTADGGYVKTLSATFTVAPDTNGFYMNVDDSDPDFVILTIWTENVSGTVDVTFPDGLIPDTTDPTLRTITSGSKTFRVGTMGTYSSRSYRFFKTSSYAENSTFTVTRKVSEGIETETAVVGKP